MRNLTPRSKSVGSLLALLGVLFFPIFSIAQTVNLTWDASTSQNTVGYNVYRGFNADGPYTKINSALDPNTAYSDSTVQPGKTYYYVTTAVDDQGVESQYSNQSEAVIPGGGPGSENVLYSFAGGSDPKLPYGGLVLDKAGNLYGTTEFGGTNNQGTVFEIIANTNGSWTESVLYNFTGGEDGGQPYGSLTFDSSGNLYGTTNFGGSTNCNLGCGTVFELTPGSGGWTESVLYTFSGDSDGREPYARLLFDAAGNLYGTTLLGGNVTSACSSGCGTVFKLTHGSSGWTESVIYAFEGGTDGASPYDGLAFDAAGNLYGSTYAGGTSSSGAIFKLAPGSSAWTESVIHSFNGGYDGANPYGDLILDAAGNLYGTTFQGGHYGYGMVFELSPTPKRGWKERLLHGFANTPAGNPVAGLLMDAAGNLYGTTMLGITETSCGGGCGALFKLTPGTGGNWTYKVVHDFGKGTDGYHPSGDLILDSTGNLYGTTQAGGAQGSGMVFEIMN
ncbi:MAG TPA: choice-of-anchor tandem repeat GloVer-containing protein [Terriglobales bacterium]|nr:choice-of-anchor tandem repeat GloVer-containing protein [Terriglobales bacterium]